MLEKMNIGGKPEKGKPVENPISSDNGVPVNMDQSIVDSMPMVRSMAMKLARRLPPHIDISDLISVGHQGLVEAAGCFDSSVNDSFKGFASIFVSGRMLDFLRKEDPLDRGPRKFLNNERDAEKELRANFKRVPTQEEIAQFLGLSLERYLEKKQEANLSERSIDDPDSGLANLVLNSGKFSRFNRNAEKMKDDLRAVIKSANLSKQEREALKLFLSKGLTRAKTGKKLGVDRSRVSQLMISAIKKISVGLRQLGYPTLEKPITKYAGD